MGHLLNVKAHVHEKLDDVHLLARRLVPDRWASWVAVRPWTAVNQVHRAAFGRGLVSAVIM